MFPVQSAGGRSSIGVLLWVHDWMDNRYALHFSFGVGASVKSQDSGGSNPEFLTGLSFSFLRTIYITGGLDIGNPMPQLLVYVLWRISVL